MTLLMLGLNHRTAPLDLREKLVLASSELDALTRQVRGASPMAELVTLSTCNRTEVYLSRPSHGVPTIEHLHAWLAKFAGVAPHVVRAVTIHRQNVEAATHLFRVACGLDSMVLGESQILGQVKRAYEDAVSRKSIGWVLHSLFQQALACAKQVRTATDIGHGRMSIGSAAVDFARQIFADFRDKTVLGIGAGDMTELMLRHLKTLEPKCMWVLNRSLSKARHLAGQLDIDPGHGGPRCFDDLDELLVESDIVLTATGSTQPIMTAKRFRPLLRRRRRRPLFLIDIAVPRDVDPEVGTLNNVHLYDLDDVQQSLAMTRDAREGQATQCEKLVLDRAVQAIHDIRHRHVGQLVRQLRQKLDTIGQTEQERTLRRLQSPAEHDPSALVEEHTRRLINKILHIPLRQLDRSNSDAPLAFYAAALKRLFDLDDGVMESPPMTNDAGTKAAVSTLGEALDMFTVETPSTRDPSSETC